MSDHTPTPWALGSHNVRAITKEAPDIADSCDHYMVAVTSAHSLISANKAVANAAFIIKSVNAHDELVKALEHSYARFEQLAEEFEKSGDTVNWAMCSTDAAITARALAVVSAPKVSE